MKIIAMAAAGLIAASALTPVPAEAQRHGYGYDRGYRDGYRGHWRGDRRGWRGDHRGWRGDRRGWRGGRSNVRCTWVRGYYGRQRQCYRVWR